MMAQFIQRGESVDFTPSRDVEAGEVVVFGGLPGVVRLPVGKGELGALALTGVYDFAKGDEAVRAGDRVFWDASRGLATLSPAGGCFLGLAAAHSCAASRRTRVILNFGQPAAGGKAPADDCEWQTL